MLPKLIIAGWPYMNPSSFFRAIHIMALPGRAAWPYDRRFGARHSMGPAAYRLRPVGRHRGPTVDESIRWPELRVQAVAAALLRMDPAARRPFIRAIIALIERIAADGSGPTSAPGTSANGDLHPHPRTLTTAPDAVEWAPM
jgi:hypothetical protein